MIVAKSCLTLATPLTGACQAPLSMRFSRQEYWSGLPFPSPGDLPDPGLEPGSPALQADSLSTELSRKLLTAKVLSVFITSLLYSYQMVIHSRLEYKEGVMDSTVPPSQNSYVETHISESLKNSCDLKMGPLPT